MSYVRTQLHIYPSVYLKSPDESGRCPESKKITDPMSFTTGILVGLYIEKFGSIFDPNNSLPRGTIFDSNKLPHFSNEDKQENLFLLSRILSGQVK